MSDNDKFVVRFQSVGKSYDGRLRVVDKLDLDVARGEFLTLLGPSGSGKTTTLMMLAGFEHPTEGEIRFNGEDITHIPPHKRGIGVVFQSYALFPHMTIAENVGYPLKIRSLSKTEVKQRVGDALAMVRLSGFGDRRPAQLSGGQQQRIALARALVFNPQLILLDEPLGALDKQLRESMQYELKQLHEKLGVTMVYVTHDQSEALTMSDRIALFNDGKIQQIAPPREIYETPANLFTAEFIGESNRLSGECVARQEDQMVVKLASGEIVHVPTRTGIDAGKAVCLSVRPERISLKSDAAGANSLKADITSLIYLGDAIRCTLRTGTGDELVAKLDITSAESLPSIGQQVTASFAPKSVSVFPA